MEKPIHYIRICRYLLILTPILGTMVTSTLFITPFYILLTLLLFINSQVRLLFLGKRVSIASLLLEILLVLYLYTRVGSYLNLILLSSLVDALMEFKEEGWILSFLIGGALLVSLHMRNLQEWVFIIGLMVLVLILLLLQLKQELGFRRDTEAFYDRIRRSNYELEEARTRLYNYSKQVERLSQLEERQRISRDLHDTLGHHLTGILMQVDAARQILPHDRDRGLEILDAAYKNINSSIEEVGRTVRRLRPAAMEADLESIGRLVEKCQQDTGLHVQYRTSGTPYRLYPSVEITLYKNIREALTNALRHGKAKMLTSISTMGRLPLSYPLWMTGRCQDHPEGFRPKGDGGTPELVGGP